MPDRELSVDRFYFSFITLNKSTCCLLASKFSTEKLVNNLTVDPLYMMSHFFLAASKMWLPWPPQMLLNYKLHVFSSRNLPNSFWVPSQHQGREFSAENSLDAVSLSNFRDYLVLLSPLKEWDLLWCISKIELSIAWCAMSTKSLFHIFLIVPSRKANLIPVTHLNKK